ncbi:unnamed protein product [Symbiodinium natans]|uniref:N-acetyltransferase domain-containing protein n=1 Tax=Symbiodinium natans TaxID=878477 RepID=A0A812NH22_9DINO|nr:unnamed protein product [Symbiodinium natans]
MRQGKRRQDLAVVPVKSCATAIPFQHGVAGSVLCVQVVHGQASVLKLLDLAWLVHRKRECWPTRAAMPCRSRDRSRSPRRAARAAGGCCAFEASKDAHRWAAYECHLSKGTFIHEACQVRTRVIAGHAQCRTFVLCEEGHVPKKVQKAKNREEQVLAACTVRMNPYLHYRKMWGQIMHISAWEERKGYGSKLVAAVEELLRQEGVDILVAYPAPTRAAQSFWAKMGYQQQERSFLPDEELLPRYEGGPLWPEQNAITEEPLDRLEKKLLVGGTLPAPREGAIRTRPGGEDRKFREVVWNPLDLRTRKAPEVFMTALQLQALLHPVCRRMRGKRCPF